MSTRELTRIALIAAIATVLSLFKVFQMPQGGSITLYLFPLYIAVANEKLRNCFFVGLVVSILQMLLGGQMTNLFSGLFDYIIPVVAIVTCGMFKQNIYVNIAIGSIIALASYTLSGMIFWQTPFVASLTYNATYFIPTVIVNVIIFALANVQISKAYKTINN
ncbi:energy-coupled thiamine transporter ThiT [Mycoplasma sp. P36-A1]|uniref:energy-coupled thiamine transporter ThiT n=1 Tax=Mycoplasma sp. P36-A1 TaxID=3252900 RepID=UPI003C2D9A80